MASREIKFRAWDHDEKIMIKNIENHHDCDMCLDERGGPDDYLKYDCECFGDFLGDKRFSVMQYTGLKDKNGKEIYEGDIVRTPATPHLTCDYLVGVVEWSQDMFSNWYAEYYVNWHGRRETHNSSFHELEKSKLFPLTVIGNIYENPELLEKHGL